MRRRDPFTRRRGLPLDRTMRPDAVLLRRELRWTAGTMLAVAAIGYYEAGGAGAAIGTAIGFLVQQAFYGLVVQAMWRGWQTRVASLERIETTGEYGRVSLRAFTVWMRTATTRDRLYIALWNVNADTNDDSGYTRYCTAEVRIRHAYAVVLKLENKALWCDNVERRRLRRSLQRDEARLFHVVTGEPLGE